MKITWQNNKFEVDDNFISNFNGYTLNFIKTRVGYSLKTIKGKCSICGKESLIDYSRISGQSKKKLINNFLTSKTFTMFCSKECSIKGKRETDKQNTKIKFCEKCNKDTKHYYNTCLVCRAKYMAFQKYKDMSDEDKIKSTEKLRESRIKAWQNMTPEERKESSKNWWSKGASSKDFREKYPEKFKENQIKAGKGRGKQLKEMFSNMSEEDRKKYTKPASDKCKRYWEIFKIFDKENKLWEESRRFCRSSMKGFTKFIDYQELIYKYYVKPEEASKEIIEKLDSGYFIPGKNCPAFIRKENDTWIFMLDKQILFKEWYKLKNNNKIDEIIEKLESKYFIPGENCPANVHFDENKNKWILNYNNFKYFLGRKKFQMSDGSKVTFNQYMLSKYEHICKYSLKETDNLQTDHIIPCQYIWDRIKWSEDQWLEYYYDENNCCLITPSINSSKGCKSISKWLPSNNIEWYCQKWLEISEKYNIPLDKKDIEVIKLYLK